MKQGIHPQYVECTVTCACGNTFKTHATVSEMKVELCNECHPFYTGQQKFVDTGGRGQRFADKFGGAAAAQLKKAEEAKAAKAADVLYTDVWVSMGEPVEVWAERIHDLAPYQINQQLMDIAGPHAVFMHCLPAYHDHKTTVGKEMGERFGRDAMEVTDEVFEGPQSIVFDEAENRMHTIKAVMYATLK